MTFDKTTRVRSYYNNFSSDYNSFYKNIQFNKYKMCIQYFQNVDEGYSIDLGGGTGLLSEFLSTKLLTADISYKMLSLGKKKNILDAVVCIDICNIPFRDNSIDTLYSFTALQNVSDHLLGLKEIMRVCSSKSSITVTVLKKIISHSKLNDLLLQLNIDSDIFEVPEEDIGVNIVN